MNGSQLLRSGLTLALLFTGLAGCTTTVGVIPLRPAPGESITDRQPTLQWEADESATSYDVRIQRFSGGLKELVFSQEGVTGTQLDMPFALEPNNEYIFQIRTRRGAAVGPWNAQRTIIFLLLFIHRRIRPFRFYVAG